MRKGYLKNNIQDGTLVLDLDKNNLNRIIRSTRMINKFCDRKNLKFEVFYKGKSINEKVKEKKVLVLAQLVKAINIKNIWDKYSYIYDTVCDNVGKEFKEHNYCKFHNEQCVENIYGKSCRSVNGCCYYNGEMCQYWKNGKCQISCISCKLFTCRYLRKKGIKFSPSKIPLLKYFLNYRQRSIVEDNMSTPKEEIIDKLFFAKKGIFSI